MIRRRGDDGWPESPDMRSPGRGVRGGSGLARVRSVATFAVAETVGRGATWLTVFLLPWLLPPDEYGGVVLMATFEGLATGFLLLGQDRAVMWRGANQDDPDRRQPWVATAVAVTAAAGLIGLGLIATASAVGTDNLLGVPVWPHLWLLAAAVVCVNVNRVVLAFVRVTGRAGEFATYRTATGLGRLVVTLGLAAVMGSSLAFPLGGAIGTLVGGVGLWRRILRGLADRLSIDRRRVVPMVRYGAPLSLHALAGSSLSFVDRWIIGSMLGLAVVGSYGWYYMLGSAVSFLFAALNVYYEPAIYRECRQTGSVTIVREYVAVSLIATGIYSLVGVVAAVFGQALIPDSVSADPDITRIVLVAHWFYPIYLAGNYLLSAFGRTVRVAAMSSVALVVVLAANLLLIPRVGPIGGAWATLAGTLSLVAAAGVLMRRLRVGARVLVGPTVAVSLLAILGILLPGVVGLAIAAAGLAGYGTLCVLRLRVSGGAR